MAEHEHHDGCQACELGMDEVVRQMDEYIKEHGWTMTYIVGEEIGFGYTIGGSDPQFFISGFDSERSAATLHAMKEIPEKILADMGVSSWEEAVEVNSGFVEVEGTGRPAFVLRKIDPHEAEMYLAEKHGCKFAIQIAWMDDTFHYPWENGYQHAKFPQHLLTEVL